MPFWLTVLLWVGFTILGELLRPKPKFGAPTPSGIGDFTVPTAQAGRAIPVIFGTVKMRGPNVTWYGDLVSAAITEKVKTGLFSSQTITKGYKYFLGQQIVLCHGPIDELLEVRFDDRAVPTGSVTIFDFGLVNNNTITFGNGPPPWFTARIPTGVYTNLTTLAQAAETAMHAAIGTTTWRVVYGYEVKPNVSDEIIYAVNFSGSATNRTAIISPGVYVTGALFAEAVALALNTKEATEAGGARVFFSATYDGQKINITAIKLREGAVDWRLNGVHADYRKAADPLIGNQMGGLTIMEGFPSTYIADYPTSPKRFAFAFAGAAGKLHLDPTEPNGQFRSAWTFGLTRAADVTIGEKMADYDRTISGLEMFDSTDKTTVVVNAPTMFGGEDREGGIVGTFDVYKGTQAQTANDYLQSVLGVNLPAYLGICYAVARKVYVGTSPYIKLISFVVRRTPNGLGLAGGKHNLNGDANPACVVYDILTNAVWGCGVPAALVDAQSFTEAAEILFTEGIGVSMIFDGQSQASDLIAEVLRHVDGLVYADPRTGKLKMKLARPDYNVADLPRFDQASVNNVRMGKPLWDETKNVVKVHYVDRAQNFTERVAQAMDLANVQARGGEISEEEFSFRGLSNAAAAQLTAARVLRTVTYPLSAFEVDANRRAWRFRPGDVFRLTWQPLGIEDMAVRITRIRDGDPRDARIMVDVVEDIFGIAWTAYSDPAATEWVDPVGPVGDLADATMIEVPYAMVVGPERLAVAVAATGQPVAQGYQVWSDVGGLNYALTNQGQLTPSGVLAGAPDGAMTHTTSSIRVTPGPLMPQLAPSSAEFAQGGAVMLIDNELIAWQFMGINTDGSFTFSGLVRGVMDTTPVPHLPGSRVWFITEGAVLVREDPYEADATINAKLLPFNALGVKDLGNATDEALVLASRAQRPYVPTNFKCNAVSYPAQISGALAMTWSHRNRLGNWSFVDAGATGSPEATTTYTIRLYDETDVLRKTYSGLTGTSQTWTTEQADSGLPVGTLNSRVRIEMEAVVGALVSHQIINFTVFRTTVADAGVMLDVVRGQAIRRQKKRMRRIQVGAAMGG